MSFESEAEYIDGGYKFEDKKNLGTFIYLKPNNLNEVLLKRSGNVNSEIIYRKGIKTKSIYYSSNLTFPFEVLTHDIKITDKHISFEYDYYYQNEVMGNIRIVLLIKE